LKMNGREKKIADDIATAIVDLMFPVVGEERGGEEADKKISLTHVTHPALRRYAAFVARETGRSLDDVLENPPQMVIRYWRWLCGVSD